MPYLAINKLRQYFSTEVTTSHKSQANRKHNSCPFKKSIAKLSFSYKIEKGYGTGNSQAVTHPSTNPACSCLTSEIERDRVYSTEYGRIRHERDLLHYILMFTRLKSAQVWFRIFLNIELITGQQSE